jgi:hypothetical protein
MRQINSRTVMASSASKPSEPASKHHAENSRSAEPPTTMIGVQAVALDRIARTISRVRWPS